MLIDTSAFQNITIADTKFFFDPTNNIIIVTKAQYYNLILDSEILYQCNVSEDFSFKKMFSFLKTKTDMPIDISKIVLKRAQNLIGTELHFYTDSNSSCTYCTDKEYAIYYGIKDPVLVKLTVSNVFDDHKKFDKSFKQNNNDVAFGFWDVEKSEISSSFIYKSPMQVKMCFSDFAQHAINQGSLFLKFKIS